MKNDVLCEWFFDFFEDNRKNVKIRKNQKNS